VCLANISAIRQTILGKLQNRPRRFSFYSNGTSLLLGAIETAAPFRNSRFPLPALADVKEIRADGSDESPLGSSAHSDDKLGREELPCRPRSGLYNCVEYTSQCWAMCPFLPANHRHPANAQFFPDGRKPFSAASVLSVLHHGLIKKVPSMRIMALHVKRFLAMVEVQGRPEPFGRLANTLSAFDSPWVRLGAKSISGQTDRKKAPASCRISRPRPAQAMWF